MRIAVAFAVALAAATACADDDAAPAPSSLTAAVTAAAKAKAIDGEVGGAPADGAPADDALAAVALPAWRGALERHRLLARRGQAGALAGVLGSDGEGGRLLIDQATGRGALFVRIALPDGVALADGRRVFAWGGFVADGSRWRFAATRVVPRAGDADAPEVADAPVLPPHRARPPVARPAGALPPSALATAVDGGLRRQLREAPLVFAVLERPVRHGAGWVVADVAGGEPSAIVLLPGEAPIYGGLDYLADDERWSLDRGTPYVATAAVALRLRRAGGLPVFDLLDAPAALEPPDR